MDNLTVNGSLGDLGGLGDYMDLAGCMDMMGLLGGINFTEPGKALQNTNFLCNFDNFEVHPDSSEFDALKEPFYVVFVIVLYIIVISLGAIGNTLVVITVVKTKQMWTATNIFIANLALADVFVCVFDLPVSVYYQITDDWIFGATLCHVIPCVLAVVVYASTLTLTLIAVDRYLLIVCPLKRRMPERMALLLMVIIALLSIAAASPIAIYAKYIIIDDPVLNLHRRYCTERWPTQQRRFLYTITTLAFQHFVPLTVIGILYFMIFRRVRMRMQSRNSRKTKTTKMLVAVVAVFAIAWTPFHLFALIGELNYSVVKGRYYKFTDATLRVVAMSSSCINPFLYGWFNENYKNAFLNLIRRKPSDRAKIHREDSEDTTKRSVVPSQVSPVRSSRFTKILQINGNPAKKFAKAEEVPLKSVANDLADSKCPCVAADTTTTPLIT